MSETAGNKDKGYYGEELAIAFLESKGYEIVKRNFHFGKIGEIDIIALKNKTLVFVEVKLRSNSSYGSPLDSITPSKRQKWRKTAEGYLYINKITDFECRFDVVIVDISSKEDPKIEHLEQVM